MTNKEKTTVDVSMSPEAYARTIIMLLESGNKKGRKIAEGLVVDLARYFFVNDPQFKGKYK